MDRQSVVMKLRLLFGLIGAGLGATLCGCHLMAPDQPNYDTYRCSNGFEFTVTQYQNGEVLVLGLGNMAVEMTRVISASGAKYSDGTLVYWYHQGEAFIMEGETITHQGCKIHN